MVGETNLEILLANMEPYLHAGSYVFLTVSNAEGISRFDTICEFKEAEGVSIILKKSKADELGLAYDYEAAWITCRIHSALEAVGFTAKIAGELATNGISCNVVAAYSHDHLFVPKAEEKRAMEVLHAITSR